MVNLELYKIFVKVAQEENITRASELLNISQPVVTTHIKNLENILGVKLFNRTNKGLMLTEIGLNLYNDIKDSVQLLDRMYNKYGKARCINLDAHAIFLKKIFNKSLINYYNIFPQIKINIQDENILESMSKLSSGEIDIILSKKHSLKLDDKIDYIKLGELHDIFVVNKNSNYKNTFIDENTLYELPFYTPSKNSGTTKHFFEETTLQIQKFKNITYTEHGLLIDLLTNTDVIALITKEFIQEELNTGEFIQLKTNITISPIEYGIYINKNNTFKELNDFIKIIKE